MKTIYYVECDSEHNSDLLTQSINELGHCGYFKTKERAHKEMLLTAKEAKDCFGQQIKKQEKLGNTITIDVWEIKVENDFNEKTDTIWDYDTREIIDSCYLCGQY